MLMRTIAIPRTRDAVAFDYRCPVCDADLAESDYETFDSQYFCPVCSTQLRPSRVPANQR
jgi:rubredoxin